jgi:putative transposase
MQVVEQHRIDRHHPAWPAMDEATFASKNLYNLALYTKRQAYIHDNHRIIGYAELDKLLQSTDAYRALPAKVAQWVLKQVCTAWDSYVAAVAEWHKTPAKFLGHPKLPQYKDKQKGRNLLVYTSQAVSRDPKNGGFIVPSQVPIRLPTKLRHDQIDQVRIVPHATHFTVEVVYERAPQPAPVDPSLVASIDIGVNNLAAITSNKPGFVPLLVNGRPVKSLNQSYNKRRGKLQSRLPEGLFVTRHLDAITDHRTRSIVSYLHTASRTIINLLVSEGIGTLVIGKNVGWKQEVEMGKKGNQRFVMIPHARFIDMLIYKAALVGIHVIVTEESYTSKCSFLDTEPIGKHDTYAGQRVKRGLFRTATGVLVNADVNGSYNILCKACPDAFAQGRQGCLLRPEPLRLPDRRQDTRKQRPRRKARA